MSKMRFFKVFFLKEAFQPGEILLPGKSQRVQGSVEKRDTPPKGCHCSCG